MTHQETSPSPPKPAPWAITAAWSGSLLLGLALAGLGIAALAAAFGSQTDLPGGAYGVIALLGLLLGAVTIRGAIRVRRRDAGGFRPAGTGLKIIGVLAVGNMVYSVKNDDWAHFWWSLLIAAVTALLLLALVYLRDTLARNT